MTTRSAAVRLRLVVNLLNGSTLAGLGVLILGGCGLAGFRDGLVVAHGYRLRVPATEAFCLGGVIITRLDAEAIGGADRLFAHEARHATQYAWCAGLVMLPLYFAAAGLSWVLTGDFASWNPFERLAGLADGGYVDRPLRPAIARVAKARSAIGQSVSSMAATFRGRPSDS